MAYWTIELWENSNGACCVEDDLLDELASKDRLLLERLFKRKKTITRHQIEQVKSSGDLKHVGDNLWELKFGLGKAHIRYLGCIGRVGPLPAFYALCALRKKSNKIPSRFIRLARERQKEFDQNQNKNEL